MAPRQAPQNLPPEPPKLLITKNEAQERLNERIYTGQTILNTKIESPHDLETIRTKYDHWNDFNKELLRRIFTTTELSDEYKHNRGFALARYNLQDEVIDLQNEIKTKIGRLESILNRLDLIPEAIAIHSSAIAPVSSASNKIFVVHGHDEDAKQSVARTIEKLGYEPIILHEQANKGMTIIEKVESYSDVCFAVVILSPDDICRSNAATENTRNRARQNVILELGYFIGKLGRESVCALYKGDLELPSDISGVIYVVLDEGGSWRFRLAQEMKSVGLEVDLNKII